MDWTERQRRLKRAVEKSERQLRKRLARIYAAEAEYLDRQIASYFAKYGKDNVIEYRALKQSLSAAEADLLRRDIDAFVRTHPQAASLRPVIETAHRIDRLDALQLSNWTHQMRIGAIEDEVIGTHLYEQAIRGANLSADMLGRAHFTENDNIIRSVVAKPWSSGEDYSSRVWSNRNRLAKTINIEIAQGFARGDKYSQLSRTLQKRFINTSKYNADRLIYTEGTYVMNESQAAVLEGDFDYYKIAPVHDGKTCPYCNDIADETEVIPVKFSDRDPGINFPPLHPWCRCAFEIVIPDKVAWMEDHVRTHADPEEAERILGEL